MREEWRPVDGYEGLYEVSNMGRVKSLKYNKERILKVGKNDKGYLQVHLSKDGKAKGYTVHRLVATAFCENPMGYTEVNHINEDKADCRAENLEWCSRSYNNTYNGRAKKAGKKSAEKLRGRKHSEEHIKKIAEKLRGRKQSEEHIRKRTEKLRGRKQSEEHNKKIAEKLSKPVIGINKVSGLIVEFSSTREAERQTGISNQSICNCLKGRCKTAGGFQWKYL